MEQNLPNQADIQRAPADIGFKITDEQRQVLIDKLIAAKMAPQEPDSNIQRLQQLIKAKETGGLGADPERVNDSVETKFAAGYIDDLTGSNITSRMTPEKMPMDRLQEAINNRRQLPRNSKGLSEKDLIELARRERGENRRQDQVADNFKMKAYDKLVKDVSKHHDEYLEHEQTVSKLYQNIADGTVGRKGAIVNGLARFVNGEKGPLAEGDVRRSMPATTQQYWSDVKAFVNNNPNEPLPPDLLQDLKAQVDIANNAYKRYYQSKINSKRRQALNGVNNNIAGYRELGEDGINTIFKDAGWSSSKEPAPKTEAPKQNPKLQQAQAWLEQNPNHPKAEAVRKTIENML